MSCPKEKRTISNRMGVGGRVRLKQTQLKQLCFDRKDPWIENQKAGEQERRQSGVPRRRLVSRMQQEEEWERLRWWWRSATRGRTSRDLKITLQGSPGGPTVKNVPCDAEDTGSTPGPGRFQVPHATEQLSLCASTPEPAL